MRRALATLYAAAVCALAPAAVGAPPTEGVARARALANEAGDLLDRKQFAEALERVEQAEAAFHAPTHLVMMGEALEGLGRLADAMAVYEKLAAEPLPQAAPQAFRRAQQEATAKLGDLIARVPSVRVVVQGAPAAGARATLDGKSLDLASGLAVRVDPGPHAVRVEAAGFAPVTRKVTLPERGGVVEVAIALEPPPPAAPPPAPTPAAEPAAPSFWRTRTPAWIALGVGGAGLAVGAVTGGLSLGKVSSLKERCPGGACAPSDQGDLDAAGALGTTSTVAFVVGGVAVAAGVVLLVVNRPPKQEPAAAGLHLGPTGLGARF